MIWLWDPLYMFLQDSWVEMISILNQYFHCQMLIFFALSRNFVCVVRILHNTWTIFREKARISIHTYEYYPPTTQVKNHCNKNLKRGSFETMKKKNFLLNKLLSFAWIPIPCGALTLHVQITYPCITNSVICTKK